MKDHLLLFVLALMLGLFVFQLHRAVNQSEGLVRWVSCSVEGSPRSQLGLRPDGVVVWRVMP